ncbi:MAG: hypothetical protein MI863_09640 [Desulfobacterales bacterium]|nr:hypothetical protein [Desulfobacterales bacterium]
MQKNVFISFLVCIVILTAGSRGEAFVPQTPHLLHLVVSKIKTPVGMVVYQTRHIAGTVNLIPEDEGGVSQERERSEDSGQDASENTDTERSMAPPAVQSVEETLIYAFPDNLRSDIVTDAGARFYALSGSGFVKVDDEMIAATEKRPVDSYTDPLLYRDYGIMTEALVRAGVNTDKVTFQRLEGRICYLIGQPSVDQNLMPGLWIDKESFFPVRYLIRNKDRVVDIRYSNWQRVSRTWYPMETRILVNGHLFTDIVVNRFELKSGFSPALFDVDKILGQYPFRKGRPDHGNEDRIDDLDGDIEDFSKLYDQ